MKLELLLAGNIFSSYFPQLADNKAGLIVGFPMWWHWYVKTGTSWKNCWVICHTAKDSNLLLVCNKQYLHL